MERGKTSKDGLISQRENFSLPNALAARLQGPHMLVCLFKKKHYIHIICGFVSLLGFVCFLFYWEYDDEKGVTAWIKQNHVFGILVIELLFFLLSFSHTRSVSDQVLTYFVKYLGYLGSDRRGRELQGNCPVWMFALFYFVLWGT